jgi:hypothetical protein
MSRRSLISAEENLIRSQRRGVPNVRMWSEQETPPRVAWDGYEEEPLPQIITWPTAIQVHALGRNGYTDFTVPSLAGYTSAVVIGTCIGSYGTVVIPAGWRVLDPGGSIGGSGGEWTPYSWFVACIDKVTGTEGLTFAWPTSPRGEHKYTRGMAMYLPDGQGGTWQSTTRQIGAPTSGGNWTIPSVPNKPAAQFASARNGRPLTYPPDFASSNMTASPLALLLEWPRPGTYTMDTLPRTATDDDAFTMRTYNTTTGAGGVSVSTWWG